MTTAHSTYQELAAGYALSALEPLELQVFTEHLRWCLPCQWDVSAYTWVAGELPYAAPLADPPDSLLAGIRQAIGAASLRSLAVPDAVVLPLRRSSPRRAAVWVSAAAAVALVASLADTNLTLRDDRDSAQQASLRLSSTVGQMVMKRKVQLRGPDGTLRGVALISADQVSLVLHGLAPADSTNSTYLLMRRSSSGAMDRVGTFTLDHNQPTQIGALPLPDAASISSLIIMLQAHPTASTSTGEAIIAVGQLS